MNVSENDLPYTAQSATTPAVPIGVGDHSHGDKSKMMNSTHNGYNNVANHKSSVDQGTPKVHHESSKPNSDHSKPKDGDVSKKHSSSSHSKSPGHDKEKKHHSHSKHSSSEHSKHSVKNGVEKVKSEEGAKKEHRSSDSTHKHSSDSKKHDKPKEKKDHPKDENSEHKKIKDKDHDKHKESKDKLKKHDSSSKDKHHEKSKDKSDKPKDKHVDKPKDKHGDKPKDKHGEKQKDKHGDKPREKHGDKSKDKTSEKPKDKHSEKHKDKHAEKTKDKSSEKPKEKSHSEKPKDKGPDIVKVKVEPKLTPEKKSEIKSEDGKSPAIVRVKQEIASPVKVKDETFSEDDMPLSARKTLKETKTKPVKNYAEDMDSDDEPISSKLSKAKKIKTESSKKRKMDDDDSEYESDYKKKPVKKVKKEKERPVKGKRESATVSTSPRKKVKKEEEQDVWKWWEEEKCEDGVKWKTLSHLGPVFAPAYERVPKNVKFYYDGKHMELSEETEEVAGFYGRMLDHDYTTKDVFNTNFFKDWRRVMTPHEKEVIKDLRKCNFNAFNDYYKMKSEERKAMTKEQKLEIKKENEELMNKYGFCVIDGHRQKIGNFKIEPPGLFRGRGEHPKMGMHKRRVVPEDISINIGKEADIPIAPGGHKWKKISHDNKVTWLVSWNENILGSTKYIMLNPSSKLKGEKDWQKYEMARKLKKFAGEIRRKYTEDFKSKEMKIRQRAVALYFIDKLALRAGNEKDEETADTVGCCSLRVEHITLDDEKDGQECVVSFDFLGKDSIRYENSVPVEKRAYKNLKLFMENKQPGDDLFDRLNTAILNKHLTELMEGLTAKVFRTYNASKTLQEQLNMLTEESMSLPEKLLAYNRANRAVAILCNHQRAIPKTFDKSMDTLKAKIDDKLELIRQCKKDLKQLKSDRGLADKKKRRLAQLEDQLKKLEVQATDKEENKQIALGTSKLNYLDPRISVAWCKKWDVPIEKIYNKTQRDKFLWAINMVGPEFEF